MLIMAELRVRGTGSLTFPVLSNLEVLGLMGNPRTPEWLTSSTGIRGHSMNFNLGTGKKIEPGDAVDYAERVARAALADAGLHADGVDQIILCTCTPAQNHFWADVIELHRRLGLRRDVELLEINSGCAGLAQAFRAAEQYARLHPSWHVLIVAANDVVSYLDVERYRRVKDAWVSFAMFADGAAAVVLSSSGQGPTLVGTHCVYDGKYPLVTYHGGGGRKPVTPDSLDAHVYLMDKRAVLARFRPGMSEVWTHFKTEFGLAPCDVSRWYLHQANLRLIEAFVRNDLGIGMERVPTNIDRFGNMVTASTLALLDEDRRFGKMPVAPFLFMWVGAGMVAGGALFQ